MAKDFLIVGLGNPGAKYENTRHNAGFKIVDLLNTSSVWKSKYDGMFNKSENMFLKPMTFMNDSGKSILSCVSNLRIAPQKVIVIHDEMDIELGRVKVKQGGGHGGHNGLKSIDAAIGKDYWRIRVGIGKPTDKTRILEHVLGEFSKEETAIIASVYAAIVHNIDKMFNLDASGFMNAVALQISENKDVKN